MITKIRTPHAAIKIWNYEQRIDAHGGNNPQKIKEEIISTVSCTGIQTSKSKSDPVGTFHFSLAPNRNWVTHITPGSWCAILMSNTAITADHFKSADPKMVKMFGKIDSVRLDTKVDQETGARQTNYLVSGKDWGQIFQTILYADPLIADNSDPDNQTNLIYKYFSERLFGNSNTYVYKNVRYNINSILSLFGHRNPLLPTAGRLNTAIYEFKMPSEMADFFGFKDRKGKTTQKFNDALRLRGGRLNHDGTYTTNINDGWGTLNPMIFTGTHTFWQLLNEMSNPALNEMYCEVQWNVEGLPEPILVNRLRPFAYRNSFTGKDSNSSPITARSNLRSKFQNVNTVKLDSGLVLAVNAGTNWNDKVNFVEIKPELENNDVYQNWTKQKCQAFSSLDIFSREGFRPMIIGTKYTPADQTGSAFDANELSGWVALNQEWFFETHLLLNGSITMLGAADYIAVGDNVMFDAGLMNPTPNYNATSVKQDKTIYVLGHIENVKHEFSVNLDGTRQYITTIDFVRGIIVDDSKNLIGAGSLDALASDINTSDTVNKNTIMVAENDNPQKEN